ncbi:MULTISPECIES: glycine betaine ABC transporter substrate-binding protein [Bacillaceae]|uniref:glycine betaine ABC transporter substrate-binding protein n=1 Tax=Bacillaceae TaxID=186817 RepID=UPI0009F84BA0|nr:MULTISPECIES: glycine betaine ABC transporter substrate-binding protein [Bacillaceae]
MKNKRFLALGGAVSFALVLGACGDGDVVDELEEGAPEEETDEAAEGDEERGTLNIGLNNWAENVAVSNMWKVILEEQGYDVELTMLEKAPVWQGVAQGDLDIAPEVWLPITDEPLYEEYEDQIELREIWYEGTGLGLVVPEYVDIDSIEELNDHADEMDGRIIGIDPGASLMRLSNEAVEEYDLDYDLVDSSEPAMMTELDSAYQNEEPIVVTLWNPHWAFADYDLKYLDDPENVYGDPDDIYYMTRTGFEDDHAEVVEWFDAWHMDDDSLGELMSVINDADDEEEGAREWIEDNRELVDEWLGEE